MNNYITVILWIAGMTTMWIPEIGPAITMLLWSYPAGAAAGKSIEEIKETYND